MHCVSALVTFGIDICNNSSSSSNSSITTTVKQTNEWRDSSFLSVSPTTGWQDSNENSTYVVVGIIKALSITASNADRGTKDNKASSDGCTWKKSGREVRKDFLSSRGYLSLSLFPSYPFVLL